MPGLRTPRRWNGRVALWLAPCWTLGAMLLPAVVHAQGSPIAPLNASFQSTYVGQQQRPLRAAYSGPNSLSAEPQSSYSFTATAMLDWRLWTGGELHWHPEVAQGVPLSRLTGLGGFTNGEIARSSGPVLKLYQARLFLRQTWGQDNEPSAVEAVDPRPAAGRVDRRRWVLTAGNLSVLDVFDGNAYSHDPRTQFLNWSLMTHGAYDYAADARGYSWGVAAERHHDDWVLRVGRFLQPRQPNQQALDPRLFRHHGDQVELEHAHTLAGQPGKWRLLVFRNRARMSRFQDALDRAAGTGGVPSIDEVRTREQVKRGFGLNLEQAVSADVGGFARASWADGRTETYAFTEIDRSVSGGVLVQGRAWARAADRLGVAVARNGLSRVHRDYLAAGGLGFFIGDGRLNYRPETVFEAFYNLNLTQAAWITLDWQHIRNPAYNADRGPARVVSLRLHTEF